jgi:hypothetical protein
MQTLDERQDGNQHCVGPEIRRELQGGGVRRLQHESTDCSKGYLEDGHDRLLVAVNRLFAQMSRNDLCC